MRPDGPTGGFPYTNTSRRSLDQASVCSFIPWPRPPPCGVWELTSAVMTAHWKGTCGEAEPDLFKMPAIRRSGPCHCSALRTCAIFLGFQMHDVWPLILLLYEFWHLFRVHTFQVNHGEHQTPTAVNISPIKRRLFPVTHHLDWSVPNRPLQYNRIKLQVFVPQAGKTAFNQRAFILIIGVSSAARCPRFETQETEHKHQPPGEKTGRNSLPLRLPVRVCPPQNNTF